MDRANEKLQELKPGLENALFGWVWKGTYVVSMVYKLPPPWEPIQTQNNVFLYLKDNQTPKGVTDVSTNAPSDASSPKESNKKEKAE